VPPQVSVPHAPSAGLPPQGAAPAVASDQPAEYDLPDLGRQSGLGGPLGGGGPMRDWLQGWPHDSPVPNTSPPIMRYTLKDNGCVEKTLESGPTHVPAVAAAAMAAVTAAAGKNALLPNRAVQEKEVDEAEEAALGAAATGTEGGYAMAADGHGVEVEEDCSPELALEQNTAALPVPGPSELGGGSLT